MLATHLFSKNIKIQITLPRQWLHVTLNVLRSNSSSSDSSSDSDSDSEPSNKTAIDKNKNVAEDSNDVTNLTHDVKSEKMKSLDYLQAAEEKMKEKQIEKQLTKAAEFLTTTAEPDKEETISSLLDNIFTIRSGNKSKKLHKFDRNNVERNQVGNKRSGGKRSEVKTGLSMIEMLKKQQNDRINVDKSEMKKMKRNIKMKEQEQNIKNKEETPSVNEDNVQSVSKILKMKKQLEKEMKQHGMFIKELKMRESLKHSQKAAESTNNVQTSKMEDHSIIKSLQNQQGWKSNTYNFGANYKSREKVPMSETFKSDEEKGQHIKDKKRIEEINRIQKFVEYERIFTNDFTNVRPTPELKMWNLFDQKELQLTMQRYPKNGFEEMIQWTEEGKLWKFPIDNEQGMEEEHNVHFSKHVFLERHLEEWCPTKGPIRHFMELVCTGLSKNPYMTIEEKYNHIMWYKDYFSGKQDLLHKLGLID